MNDWVPSGFAISDKAGFFCLMLMLATGVFSFLLGILFGRVMP